MLQFVHVAKTVAGTLIPHGLADSHFKPTILAPLAARQPKVAPVKANRAHRTEAPQSAERGLSGRKQGCRPIAHRLSWEHETIP